MLEIMKIFGLCPVCTTPSFKNYLIPFIMFLLNLAGGINRIQCFLEKEDGGAGYGSFDSILQYLYNILIIAYFTVIYRTTARKIKSWSILLKLTELHPKTWKSFIPFVIHLVFLFIVVSEGYDKHGLAITHKISWLYIQVSSYLINMLMYLALTFLLIIEMLYNRIDKCVRDTYRKFSNEKLYHIRQNHIHRHFIKEIRSKYLYYYNIIDKYTDVFGWIFCYLVTWYVLKFIISAQNLFYENTQQEIVYKISWTLQIILSSVSYFYIDTLHKFLSITSKKKLKKNSKILY